MPSISIHIQGASPLPQPAACITSHFVYARCIHVKDRARLVASKVDGQPVSDVK